MALVDVIKKYFQRNTNQWIGWLVIVSIVTLSLGMPWPPNQEAKAVDGNMILFWDGNGALPTDWTELSDSHGSFYNRYIRGDSSTGGQGGNATHTHTLTYVSEETGGFTTVANDYPAAMAITAAHSHGTLLNEDITSNNNEPDYRRLRVMQYSSGAPTTIPSGAIAMFETATVPSVDWSLYSAQDNYFLRGGDSVTVTNTGGDTTPSHNVASGLEAAADMEFINNGGSVGYAIDHGHNQGSPTSTDTPSIAPPYNEIVFLKAISDITSFPPGIIAGFSTSTMPTDWKIRSASSGSPAETKYYQRFLFGDSSGNLAVNQGSTTHSHANVTVTTDVPDTTASDAEFSIFGVNVGSDTHTHAVTIQLGADVNHMPLYTGLVLGQYSPQYTPDSRNWWWFDSEDTATPDESNIGGETATGDAMAAENTMPTNTRIVYKGNAIKLRFVFGETNATAGTDVKYQLQYDTSDTFPSPTTVGDQDSEVELWRYYDGDNVTDDDTVTLIPLTGSPTAGRHNENKDVGLGYGSDFDPAASTIYEHEFTIQNYNATANTMYYFRVQYFENSQAANPVGITMAKNASYTYPSIRTAAAYDLETYQVPANVSLGSYTQGGGNALQYIFQAGEEVVFWDKRGTAPGVSVVANAFSMTCTDPIDIMPGTDVTWTSTAADSPDETKALKGSFASDRTGTTGNNGQTLDVDRTAYSLGSSADKTVRTGGFYFLPTLDLANLDSREVCNFTGTLQITII